MGPSPARTRLALKLRTTCYFRLVDLEFHVHPGWSANLEYQVRASAEAPAEAKSIDWSPDARPTYCRAFLPGSRPTEPGHRRRAVARRTTRYGRAPCPPSGRNRARGGMTNARHHDHRHDHDQPGHSTPPPPPAARAARSRRHHRGQGAGGTARLVPPRLVPSPLAVMTAKGCTRNGHQRQSFRVPVQPGVARSS